MTRYSQLMRGQNHRVLSAPTIALRGIWAFFRTYVLRLGFLDGWRGLVIAVSDANGVFFKYMEPYADDAIATESGTPARVANGSLRDD